MKKTATYFLFLVLLSHYPVIAQNTNSHDNTNIKTTRQGFGFYRGIVMPVDFANPALRTEGSPYYFDNWNNQATLLIKDKGNVKIEKVNINLYANKFEAVYDENNVFTFDSNNLIRIKINDKIFRTFVVEDQIRILELLFDGKLSVYKDYSVTYAEGSPNPMLSRKTNKYIKKPKYYVYDDGTLKEMKMNKKSVSKLLQSENISSEGILDYMKQNKLSLSDEGDLTQLFQYVNSQLSNQ